MQSGLPPADSQEYPAFVTGLRCLRCGRMYAPHSIDYVCGCRPNQGSDLGTLDVEYNYARILEEVGLIGITQDPEPTMGRYWPLLPIHNRSSLPSLGVGATPLISAPRLAGQLGLSRVLVKDDGRNPSASLKDRASAVAVAKAQELGRPVVATASTGNAAAALAAMSAAAAQPNVIFVPKSAPPAKIAQLQIYGSVVLAIDGSYDQAFDLCIAACTEFGWYNRNTGYNPYMTEGKKTVAFEIAEQLAASAQGAAGRMGRGAGMAAPDAVFVSVGDGCIIGGVYKGFADLIRLGWISQMPRIYGVQSRRSAALAAAWEAGKETPDPVSARTRADSISVDAPRDAAKALRAVRESGGAFLLVEDEAILAAISPLAQLAAVFAEPAGAAAHAGLVEAVRRGMVGPQETIVVLNTGSGLKDIQAVREVTGEPAQIVPTLGAVHEVVAAHPALSG